MKPATNPEAINATITSRPKLAWAWECVRQGAQDAGRDVDELQLGLIFHVVPGDDPKNTQLISKSVAAGYYEYSQFLFDAPGFSWNGTDVERLKQQVWPDFLHDRDLVRTGELVDFLSDDVADGFSLNGSWAKINQQLEQILNLGLPAQYIVPHPMLGPNDQRDFLGEFAREVIPRYR